MLRYEVSELYDLIRNQSIQGCAVDALFNNKALSHHGNHIFRHNLVRLSTRMCSHIIDSPLRIITLVLDA